MSPSCKFFVALWLQAGDLHIQRLAFAFAPLRQPGAQSFSETFGCQSKARLDLAIRYRQRVVEFDGVSEIPHAKLIEPLERTGAPLSPYDYVHLELLRIHARILQRRVASRPSAVQLPALKSPAPRVSH
jgi:hypothetical protein